MLQMRPGCECCDRDLPADSTEAWICSFECTFCTDCVEGKLERNPASTTRIHKPQGCA